MIDPEMILPLSLLAGIGIYFIVMPFLAKKDEKKEFEKLENETETPPPEPVLVRATVTEKRIDGRHSGGKVSKYGMHFIAIFKTDADVVLEFEVPKELFDVISEGQEGDLVTINGNFFDFGDG